MAVQRMTRIGSATEYTANQVTVEFSVYVDNDAKLWAMDPDSNDWCEFIGDESDVNRAN